MEPDALIIQDPTLLHQVDVFGGLERDGYRPDQQLARASTSSASASFVERLPATSGC